MPGGHKLTREETTQVPRGAGDQNRAFVLHVIQYGRVVRVSMSARQSRVPNKPRATNRPHNSGLGVARRLPRPDAWAAYQCPRPFSHGIRALARQLPGRRFKSAGLVLSEPSALNTCEDERPTSISEVGSPASGPLASRLFAREPARESHRQGTSRCEC
jgi:hypothetical protein